MNNIQLDLENKCIRIDDVMYKLSPMYDGTGKLPKEIIDVAMEYKSIGSCPNCGWNLIQMNNPKSSASISKEYEIVRFSIGEKFYDNMPTLGFQGDIKIHSVKRLSDNTVFSIGDELNNTPVNGVKITEIEISEEWDAGVVLKCRDNESIALSIARKKPILITEDGVEKYLDDTVVCVYHNLTHCQISNNGHIITADGEYESGLYKYFHSEEKAKEYISNNRKSISYQELHDELMKYVFIDKSKTAEFLDSVRMKFKPKP